LPVFRNTPLEGITVQDEKLIFPSNLFDNDNNGPYAQIARTYWSEQGEDYEFEMKFENLQFGETPNPNNIEGVYIQDGDYYTSCGAIRHPVHGDIWAIFRGSLWDINDFNPRDGEAAWIPRTTNYGIVKFKRTSGVYSGSVSIDNGETWMEIPFIQTAEPREEDYSINLMVNDHNTSVEINYFLMTEGRVYGNHVDGSGYVFSDVYEKIAEGWSNWNVPYIKDLENISTKNLVANNVTINNGLNLKVENFKENIRKGLSGFYKNNESMGISLIGSNSNAGPIFYIDENNKFKFGKVVKDLDNIEGILDFVYMDSLPNYVLKDDKSNWDVILWEGLYYSRTVNVGELVGDRTDYSYLGKINYELNQENISPYGIFEFTLDSIRNIPSGSEIIIHFGHPIYDWVNIELVYNGTNFILYNNGSFIQDFMIPSGNLNDLFKVYFVYYKELNYYRFFIKNNIWSNFDNQTGLLWSSDPFSNNDTKKEMEFYIMALAPEEETLEFKVNSFGSQETFVPSRRTRIETYISDINPEEININLPNENSDLLELSKRLVYDGLYTWVSVPNNGNVINLNTKDLVNKRLILYTSNYNSFVGIPSTQLTNGYVNLNLTDNFYDFPIVIKFNEFNPSGNPTMGIIEINSNFGFTHKLVPGEEIVIFPSFSGGRVLSNITNSLSYTGVLKSLTPMTLTTSFVKHVNLNHQEGNRSLSGTVSTDQSANTYFSNVTRTNESLVKVFLDITATSTISNMVLETELVVNGTDEVKISWQQKVESVPINKTRKLFFEGFLNGSNSYYLRTRVLSWDSGSGTAITTLMFNEIK